MGSVSINERIRQIAENADFKGENDVKGDNIPLQDKTPLETNTGRLQSIADNNTKLRKHYKAVLDEYSENRRRAGSLRKEIAIGSRDGEDLRILFLKAVECISKMTGDSAYNNSVKEHLENRLNPVSPDNQE